VGGFSALPKIPQPLRNAAEKQMSVNFLAITLAKRFKSGFRFGEYGQDKGISIIVILSGVFLDEGEKNGVEGSAVVHQSAKLHEILRLRSVPLCVTELRSG
jgi:hypothetical protein